jgi:hypothetical protein
MARYRVSLLVRPVPDCPPLNARDAIPARRVVPAPCAREAACKLARPYLDAGLVVDWTVRRAGVRGLGRRWCGQFVPGDGDDGTAGVREPRRPQPPAGNATAAAELPAA